MTKSVDRSQGISLAQELKDMKDVNKFAVSILNVVFSIVAVFTAVYYFSYTVTNDPSMVYTTILNLYKEDTHGNGCCNYSRNS